MPLSDKLKSTIWSAVHKIEGTMDIHYPKSFSTIEDAKAHIGTVCVDNNFQYCLYANHNLRPSDPHQVVRIVKDKVCYLVAVRAHNQGEFYLDEPLPDRKSLRDAIEADISRTKLLIPNWPTEFFDADVAAKYVAGVCALNKFEYTPFEGVTPDKFKGYVTFNTARQAFTAGLFGLKIGRKDWARNEKDHMQTSKQTSARPQTLQDAIEHDVYYFLSFVPRSFWPQAFTDLNEARNFIQKYCYETKFRYTGWPNLVAQRYRLFVHYNAAKYALADGMFKIEQETPETKPAKEELQEKKDGNDAHEDKLGVEVVDPLATIEETNNLGHDDRCVNHVQGSEVGATDCDSELSPAWSTPSSETSNSFAGILSKALTEINDKEAVVDPAEQKKAAAVDPFEASASFPRHKYSLLTVRVEPSR
ncbi:hypothetical protein EJ07DRAFT_152403 [Lizonia empirigonia]|nr:hypothetical protein EJ07DRAFT_152403 [Lizonia empirigonia]